MIRHLKLALIALPLIAGLLGGCTVIVDDHYRHPHYGYWR